MFLKALMRYLSLYKSGSKPNTKLLFFDDEKKVGDNFLYLSSFIANMFHEKNPRSYEYSVYNMFYKHYMPNIDIFINSLDGTYYNCISDDESVINNRCLYNGLVKRDGVKITLEKSHFIYLIVCIYYVFLCATDGKIDKVVDLINVYNYYCNTLSYRIMGYKDTANSCKHQIFNKSLSYISNGEFSISDYTIQVSYKDMMYNVMKYITNNQFHKLINEGDNMRYIILLYYKMLEINDIYDRFSPSILVRQVYEGGYKTCPFIKFASYVEINDEYTEKDLIDSIKSEEGLSEVRMQGKLEPPNTYVHIDIDGFKSS